jgi:hypothetical protein
MKKYNIPLDRHEVEVILYALWFQYGEIMREYEELTPDDGEDIKKDICKRLFSITNTAFYVMMEGVFAKEEVKP